jgi:hypothetical protein
MWEIAGLSIDVPVYAILSKPGDFTGRESSDDYSEIKGI